MSNPRKRRLLIGENNSALRDFLKSVLWADGYDVVATSTTDDLLDTLAVSLHPEFSSGEFDLVIAEVHMLGAVGLSALDKFEELANAPPMVLIADSSDKKLNAKVMQSRKLAMVDNPVNIDDLRRLVQRLLIPPPDGRPEATEHLPS